MGYRYKVMESVLESITKDHSVENIFDQVDRLTSDEKRKLSQIMQTTEDAIYASQNYGK
tara:strand:- start:48 stop:224 length:177 start_codon:yes stop_codon:yes gene_type:complete